MSGSLRAPSFLPSFVCPECGRISHNPNDVANRYCGACHKFFDVATEKARHALLMQALAGVALSDKEERCLHSLAGVNFDVAEVLAALFERLRRRRPAPLANRPIPYRLVNR